MRLRPFLLFFPLFATWVAPAQRATPPRATATTTVTGHVFCNDTNAPARLASVVLEPASAIDGYKEGDSKGVSAHMEGVQTLPDGSFSFAHVAPGPYYVFASLPGYVSPLAMLAATGEDLGKPDKAVKEEIEKTIPRVTAQPNLPASIDLTLARGAAVSGTVLYDDGSPAVGLDVELQVKQKDKWVTPRLGPVQDRSTATTDDRGVYRIGSLPPGKYLVAVQLRFQKTSYDVGGGGMSMSNEGSTIPVYSGDKLRPKNAAPFTLKLGEERPGEDIQIPLAKLHTVSGSITAARDGHALNGGRVALLHADDKSELASATLGKGDTVWTIGFVPEGDYLVRVTDAADMDFEEVPNPPGSMPATNTISHTAHHYGYGEEPLHVEGEVTGFTVSVPELQPKKNVATQ